MGELKPFLSTAGSKVTPWKSKNFVGAERLTSGFAVVNAAIESLLYVDRRFGEAKKAENNQHQHPITIGESILLARGSRYVVKLLQGQYRTIENKLLVGFLLHLWKLTGSFSLRVC